MTSITVTDPRPVQTATPTIRRRWSVSSLANLNRAVIVAQDNA